LHTENLIASPGLFTVVEIASPTRGNFPAKSVQRLNPLENPNWDTLVGSHPNFSFFHGAAWAKVLTDTYHYTPVYFAASENETLKSLLPVMEADSWLTGRRGISLPFTDDCEPLCADHDSFKKLFESAVEFGKARGWKYLECRGGRKFFGEATASLSFYGHSLDLTAGEQKLFEALESSVRRAIRKAEKDGVKVEILQSEKSVRIFHALLCKTRKRHGLPPQPLDFFLNIHKHILSQDKGVVIVATYQDKPVAASVYFQMGGRAIYKYGASDEIFQHLRGNNLVMWEAIKWLAGAGVKKLHFGKTSVSNEGLRRFKLGWGAVEEKIEYVKYDLRKNGFVTDNDEIAGWHNQVFRTLPVFASRLIGRALYRHWA
jgi:Acetyltransferase (GNAT) domain